MAHAVDGFPKFEDYPANTYNGVRAPLVLDTAEAREYRTRLRAAAKGDINFGGRYVFTRWGAGNRCDYGALVDVATGKVHFLPFTSCNWSKYGRPFKFSKHSRLLAVAGQIAKDSPADIFFFEFTGTDFKPVMKKSFFAALLGQTDNDNIEPAAGPVEAPDSKPLEGTPAGLDAFTDAVIFGIHRLNFNDTWQSDLEKFSLLEAQKLARALIASSIKERYELRGARYVLFYNSSADLFALMRAKEGEKTTVGLIPGRYFSEELYKFKERPNYLDNMLKNRPVVFRQLVKDFPRSNVFDGTFAEYRKNEELSRLVKINLVAFLEFTKAALETGCRESVTQTVNKTDITFGDSKESSQLGAFYLSTVFPVAAAADKPIQLAAAFHDKQTNRYGGYAIFMPGGKHKCKVTLVIPSVY